MVDNSVFLTVLWLFPHLLPSFGPEARIAKKSVWHLSCCKWYIWGNKPLNWKFLLFFSLTNYDVIFHFAPESLFSILKFTVFYLYDVKIYDKMNTILEFSCSFYWLQCYFKPKRHHFDLSVNYHIHAKTQKILQRGSNFKVWALQFLGQRTLFSPSLG